MAIASTCVWEVRIADGNDANGGGFNAWRAGATKTETDNYTYGASAAVIPFTDLSIYATTANRIHSAGRDFVAADIGHVIRITAGTGWNIGFYEITTVSGTGATNYALVTGATNVTTNTSPGGAGSGNLGGALASPGMAGGAAVSVNSVWIQSGTYVISSTTPNVSTGVVATNTGAAVTKSIWEGYQTTRGDLGTPPVFQVAAAGVTSVTVVAVATANSFVRNITVDGQSKSAITGFYLSDSYSGLAYCYALSCTVYGIRQAAGAIFCCRASGCSGTAAFGGTAAPNAFGCEAYDNTVIGFGFTSGTLAYCLAYRNRGAGVAGFNLGLNLLHCVAYYNEGDGFNLDNANGCFVLADCLAISNGDEGFGTSAVRSSPHLINCGGYDNASGNYSTTNLLARSVTGFLTLGGNPFVSVSTSTAGAANFALNNLSGAGKACRAAGWPGTYASGTTRGYVDVGGAHHLDAGTQTIIVPQRFFQ